MDNTWINDIIETHKNRKCCENCKRFVYSDIMRRVGTCNFPCRQVSADECCQLFEYKAVWEK